MMRISVFIATSLDGFIARPDGDIDWLMSADANNDGSEDYGYRALYESSDCLIMGRNSFEKVRSFADWPYPGKRLIVLSQQMTSLPPDTDRQVELHGDFHHDGLHALVDRLATEGCRHLYIDGGVTIQGFLRAGLVSDIILTTIPILLGKGRRLFGPIDEDIPLKLVNSRSFPSGFVQTHYQI